MKKINVILSAVIYAFGIFYLYQILMLPDRNMPGTLKSSFMPILLLTVLLGVNTVFLLISLLKPCIENCDYKIHRYEISGIINVILLIVGYVFLMRYAGFLLITPVMVFLLMKLMGAKNLKEMIIASGMVSISVYLVFVVFFKVMLPGGIII